MRTVLALALTTALLSSTAHAGEEDPAVEALVEQAVARVDAGKPYAGIALLDEALRIDRRSVLARYELAYTYFQLGDYGDARKHLRKTSRQDDPGPQTWQALGACEEMLGNEDKARSIYEKGLAAYPGSGGLHLNLALLDYNDGELARAMRMWETGLQTDPTHAGNYFYMTLMVADSDELGWSMLYGETFANLEPGTQRTWQMGTVLYDVYQASLSEAAPGALKVETTSSDDPFDMAVEAAFTSGMDYGGVGYRQGYRSLDEIYRLRMGTLVAWYGELEVSPGKIVTSPEPALSAGMDNAVLAWWRELVEAGHFEAYTYWLLGPGSPEEAVQWTTENMDRMNAFLEWTREHRITLNERLHTSRRDYRGWSTRLPGS